jgi:hypothetical protein
MSFLILIFFAFQIIIPILIFLLIMNRNKERNIKRRDESFYQSKTELCSTCGREIDANSLKCPYCNAASNNYYDENYFREDRGRRVFIVSVSIILIITMLFFVLIALTPFRMIKSQEVFEIIREDIFQGSSRTETNNELSSKYSYWDGIDEKIIAQNEGGTLKLEYSMESKEGTLYSVVKDSDNNLILHIPGNISGEYIGEITSDKIYYIVVVGQETKGHYKFKWSID